MPTIKQEVSGLNWVNLIVKLKSIFTKIESEKIIKATAIAAMGNTTDLIAAVVVPATIADSNLTAANAAAPTKAEVDAGINTLKAAVVNVLNIKADNVDLETLITSTEARLAAIEAKVDAVIAALKTSGVTA